MTSNLPSREQLLLDIKVSRKIRNIEIEGIDLRPLVMGMSKIPGCTINAFAALLQQGIEDRDGQADFCMFSSWLGPLIDGTQKERVVGSIDEHIMAACSEGTKEALLAKKLWLIPLCSGTPPHWVLTWINVYENEYGMFDSVPELISEYWAIPLLLKIADRILQFLSRPKINWEIWSKKLTSPPPLLRQLDSWSCGIFVMLALKVFAYKEPLDLVTNDRVDETRQKALSLLLKNLPLNEKIIPPTKPSLSFGTIAVPENKKSDSPKPDSVENLERMSMVHPELAAPSVLSSPGIPMVTSSDPLGSRSTDRQGKTQSLKRSRTSSDGDDDGYTTPTFEEKEAKKARSLRAEEPRSKQKSSSERRAALEEHPGTKAVEAHRVQCNGCRAWIKLNKTRTFEKTNWINHTATCPGLTGKLNVRTRIENNGKLRLGEKEAAENTSITSFFQRKQSRKSTNSFAPAEPTSCAREASGLERPTTHAVTYTTRSINATPSITSLFSPGTMMQPGVVSKRASIPIVLNPEVACQHLQGPKYTEYINRTQTYSLGGVSMKLRGRLVRQTYYYKKLKALKVQSFDIMETLAKGIPPDGNACLQEKDWTPREQQKLDQLLIGWARWEVNHEREYVRSTRCKGTTREADAVCSSCRWLEHDESLKRSIRRKLKEAAQPIDVQHEMHLAREKYSGRPLLGVEGRKLKDQLQNKEIFAAYKLLESGKSGECFLHLYSAVSEGKMTQYQNFVDLCSVLQDRVRREASDNKKLICGIRYPRDVLNMMILIRSYGSNSGRQYDFLKGLLGGPSPRHLRTLVANSEDALQNPNLIYENIARVKRLVVSIGYCGPIAVAGDCTKVRKRLTFSTDFGSHILGSVLPLNQCEVQESEDITIVIEKIMKSKTEATQARAILIKVPLPHIPPLVVALIPTDGTDDALQILELNLQFLAFSASLGIPVVSAAADGAASELLAQKMMDSQVPPFPPLTYEYPLYGIYLSAPVFKTGPLISVSDPPHGRKTCRNQPQHGTHTASLGVGYLVNRSLVNLYRTGTSGLVLRDVENVDKQDDGAARRDVHFDALKATTVEVDGVVSVGEGFLGLFVYNFILGILFDAWLNRSMTIRDRVLAALRARFFLHFWRSHIVSMSSHYPDLYSTARSFISPASFHIFNRLCDSLVLLVLAYAKCYKDQPFCPWLMGTEFVEHFFGVARSMLPNFTYAEFLKISQHVMVRQKILLSGKYSEKRERSSASGYSIDFDTTPLSAKDQELAHVTLTKTELDSLVRLAFDEARHICKDLLRIPVPLPTADKPIILIALGAPQRKKKLPLPSSHSKNTASSDPKDSDSESELEDEDLDDDSANDPDITEASPIIDADISISAPVALATRDVACYSALCEDYDNAIEEAKTCGKIDPSHAVQVASQETRSIAALNVPVDLAVSINGNSDTNQLIPSVLLDGTGTLSISLMLQARLRWQSGTTTRSERVVKLDSKYAIKRMMDNEVAKATDKEVISKMTRQEASQRVRLAQELNNNVQIQRPKKARELRWKGIVAAVKDLVDPKVLPNLPNKNVDYFNQLKIGTFVIMRNKTRFYIGQILDIYKKGANSRHGSLESAISPVGLSYLSLLVYLPLTTENIANVDNDLDDDSDDLTAPLFSCQHRGKTDLHTHAEAQHLLFNLGPVAWTSTREEKRNLSLTPEAALRWLELTKPGTISKEMRKIAPLRIPGGKMARK